MAKQFETVQGRNARYCNELKGGYHLLGKKVGENLTPAEAGFRMGVLTEQRRARKRFKFLNPGYKRKTK